tara:strand:- start:312 stop:1073 length:762 start_codon:yes stop_codon:yes gene_type:complete
MLNFSQTINLELFGTVNIYLGIGIQIIFALLLGGMVGLDREIKSKSAGLKTNIMICLGATLYTSISLLNIAGSEALVDPNRLSAQIVSGIGFLGAGAIIQGRGSVTGLTTAATIWVVAAIGYTIGVGYPIVALFFSLTVLVVLKMINPLNKFIERKNHHTYFHVELLSYQDATQTIRHILRSEEIKILNYKEVTHSERSGMNLVDIYIKGHYRAIDRISHEFIDSIKISKSNIRQIEELPTFLHDEEKVTFVA